MLLKDNITVVSPAPPPPFHMKTSISRRFQVLLSERGKARSCSGSQGAGYHLSRRAWRKSRLEDLGVDRGKYAWGAGEGRWVGGRMVKVGTASG